MHNPVQSSNHKAAKFELTEQNLFTFSEVSTQSLGRPYIPVLLTSGKRWNLATFRPYMFDTDPPEKCMLWSGGGRERESRQRFNKPFR